MIRSSKVLAGAAAIAVLVTTGVAHAFTVPDFKGTDPSIAAPGDPDFWSANFAATLEKNPGNVYTLSITACDPNIGIFNFPGAAYVVGNESVKLTANFDSTGHLLTNLSNTFEVDGSLKSSSSPDFGSPPGGFAWSAQPIEKLWSTTLTAVTVDSPDEALGFKATGFGGWANQKQFTGGSTTESVWLYSLLAGVSSWSKLAGQNDAAWNSFLAEVKNHGNGGLKAGTFYGIAAIATVPIPAAVWMLCSGLAGLGAAFRRRSTKSGSPAAA
jgi:hypothetical protein